MREHKSIEQIYSEKHIQYTLSKHLRVTGSRYAMSSKTGSDNKYLKNSKNNTITNFHNKNINFK